MQNLVHLMTGRSRTSVLMTDGYKFSMAQAGFPLREETFYLVLRKGGPHYTPPYDLGALVMALLPEPATTEESAFLTAYGYGMTAAMEKALRSMVRVHAAPPNTWVMAGEPILTVTGPSFLVSWLEPLLISLQAQIQMATAIRRGQREFSVSCLDEALILRNMEKHLYGVSLDIHMELEEFRLQVQSRALQIKEALNGETYRTFEVGMRAASCMAQHRIALTACFQYGVSKTSNVYLAKELGMTPVGTTGHEHQQRWGNDLDAFRAIRDMRSTPPSYLFDTFDPYLSGIPAAIKVMAESEGPCSVRFDSGDQEKQLRLFLEAGNKIYPNFIFEDGYTAERTRTNEKFCADLGVDKTRRFYGFGGFLVPATFSRDAVSAVYKLTQTGDRPTMKFSDSGKGSVPGKPVIFRAVGDQAPDMGLIGQMDETPPEGYTFLANASPRDRQIWDQVFTRTDRPCITRVGPATEALMQEVRTFRDHQLAR